MGLTALFDYRYLPPPKDLMNPKSATPSLFDAHSLCTGFSVVSASSVNLSRWSRM